MIWKEMDYLFEYVHHADANVVNTPYDPDLAEYMLREGSGV